jgi:hypothetical protein
MTTTADLERPRSGQRQTAQSVVEAVSKQQNPVIARCG